jgi:hypothetical protein
MARRAEERTAPDHGNSVEFSNKAARRHGGWLRTKSGYAHTREPSFTLLVFVEKRKSRDDSTGVHFSRESA